MNATSQRLSLALADRYRIEREIGAGGMATVYLAHDVRHQRDVAIKVLHPDLGAALGGERFLTEIRTTARLQHPHILPLLDSGEADGLLYYVMPLVTGETLRVRMERERQLPIPEAIRIAREVASALDYAHRQSVIHRDIKPENILLHDGQAIVADFGIALAVQSAGGQRMTQTGLSLGTPQYMSPEQAMGERAIDARSDVYALGAVLYEMLAGDAPFTGGSVQAIVAKVLSERPTALRTLRDTVPVHVEDAVFTALAKLPADRFASAKEFSDALGHPASGIGASLSGASATRSSTPRRRLQLGVGAASLVALTALAAWTLAAPRDRVKESVHLAFSSAPAQPLGPVSGRNVAISPDGRTIVYATPDSTGRNSLWVRRLDDLRQTQIANIEEALFPIFSPDGASVAYLDVEGRQLKRVELPGGTPTTLSEIAGTFQGAAWTADGIVVSIGGVLLLVPSAGGTPIPLLSGDSLFGYYPVALPGGTTVAFAATFTVSSPIRVFDIRKRRATTLAVAGVPVGVLDGRLLYYRRGALWAAPYDAVGPRVDGAEREVLPDVRVSLVGQPKVAVSPSGSIVYVTGSNLRQLVSVDMRGVAQKLPIPMSFMLSPRFSPDGRRVLADVAAPGREDVWIYDLADGTSQRMTFDGTSNTRAEWSSDGTRILYRTVRGDSNATFWWKPADGSGSASQLAAMPGRDVWQAVLTPDGEGVVLRVGTLGQADIYYRRLKGDTATMPIAATKFDEVAPRLSPDGRWIAYSTDESGMSEVVVRPFPGPGAQTAISAGGGTTPIWSRDGRRIFFARGTQMFEARVSTTPTFSVTSRRSLFQGDYFFNQAQAMFDVSRDGNSLLMLRNDPNSAEQIVVIHNWQAELKAKFKVGVTP